MGFLNPIQERYKKITDKEIIDLIEKNTKIVKKMAEKKIEEVYKKIGFSL